MCKDNIKLNIAKILYYYILNMSIKCNHKIKGFLYNN